MYIFEVVTFASRQVGIQSTQKDWVDWTTTRREESLLYLQVIYDACVKIAVLEIYSEKKTRESVVATFKNICTTAVH